MLKKVYKTIFVFSALLLPHLVGAQLEKTGRIFGSAYGIMTRILIPAVFTLALLLFFWGIAKYIWGEGQGKADGRKIMIWGVIALFVASSIWGIVYFIRTEFNIVDNANMPIPTIGGPDFDSMAP